MPSTTAGKGGLRPPSRAAAISDFTFCLSALLSFAAARSFATSLPSLPITGTAYVDWGSANGVVYVCSASAAIATLCRKLLPWLWACALGPRWYKGPWLSLLIFLFLLFFAFYFCCFFLVSVVMLVYFCVVLVVFLFVFMFLFFFFFVLFFVFLVVFFLLLFFGFFVLFVFFTIILVPVPVFVLVIVFWFLF